MLKKIPQQVAQVLHEIEKNGYEAYIVGGCVRDLLMDKIPNDWDITTNAIPQKVQEIFPDSFYENDFGTVGVKVEPFLHIDKKREHDVVEVTTFRVESTYSDKRRPDGVEFAETLEEDLSRRDFTMNAIALRVHSDDTFEIVDIFGGKADIKKKMIKAVGSANERFNEDALRMMRAVRFHAQLGFEIENKTLEGIKNNVQLIDHIAWERIKDEFTKIILSDFPAEGVDMMHEVGLLAYVLPELEIGVGMSQNRHHIHSIYTHSLLSLKYCPSKKLEVRLAALLHDIAKPQTKRGEGEFATFYNHDHVGAKISRQILSRMKFSNEVIQKVVLLVDNHMFYYLPEEVGDSSVRRLIKKVGLENMKDLIDLRVADRLGSGVKKAKPYKLRHLEFMIDKVSKDAVSVKMLKISGNDIMQTLGVPPGPIIGAILDVLLAEVIEDASKNNREYLLSKANKLSAENLDNLRELAKEKIEEKKMEDEEELKKGYWVK